MEISDYDGPKKAPSVPEATRISYTTGMSVLGVLKDEQPRGTTGVVERASGRACTGAGTTDRTQIGMLLTYGMF
jgi:hypothetical protein